MTVSVPAKSPSTPSRSNGFGALSTTGRERESAVERLHPLLLLMEAIWVAAEMRAGGAYAHWTLALDVASHAHAPRNA